jgi:hypothetical protein
MKLAILIECIVPSANMCVVVCQQTGRKFAAEALAATFILQYLLMLVTLLVYVTVALRLVGIGNEEFEL